MFKIFAKTNVAKHYFASVYINEGNVLTTTKLEKKGVGLKNSQLPKTILKLLLAHQ